MKDGELDYVWLWILCGLPFGLHRMCLWIVPGGGSLGGGIALFALNFIIGGVIGGFILAWSFGARNGSISLSSSARTASISAVTALLLAIRRFITSKKVSP